MFPFAGPAFDASRRICKVTALSKGLLSLSHFWRWSDTPMPGVRLTQLPMGTNPLNSHQTGFFFTPSSKDRASLPISRISATFKPKPLRGICGPVAGVLQDPPDSPLLSSVPAEVTAVTNYGVGSTRVGGKGCRYTFPLSSALVTYQR